MTRKIPRVSAALAGKFPLLAFPLAVVAFLALPAAPALGALTHPLKATFGSFSNPVGIAIDGANENVLVADAASNSVEIFGPEGGAPSSVAVTEFEALERNEVIDLAIDNAAASPSKGALYVTDRASKDDSALNFVRKYTLNPVSEEYELKETLSATPALKQPRGIAVDAKGNVFVSDRVSGTSNGFIVEFSPTGVEIGRISLSESSPTLQTYTTALAFDSAGNLFALSGSVWKFAANGSGEVDLSASPTRITGGSSTGIAVDQDTDTLYVAVGKRVVQYSASCVPVEGECEPQREFGTGILGSTQRVAVSPVNDDIYVTDRGRGDVALFGAALSLVPDPITEAATEVKQTAANLNGTVNADGGPAASCEFEYTTKASFDLKGFEGASTAPCSPAGPFTGSSIEPVKAEVSGLSTETAYVFRLAASNENGPNFGEALSFSTVGKPMINATLVSAVSLDSAAVEGLVNPNGGPGAAVETTYAIEYVSEEDFEASGYANAVEVPPGGKGIGSGTKDVKVAQQLSGLSVGTTYHFRILAENEAGEEVGPDTIFATYPEPLAGLPDARAYEQVTPTDKNGSTPTGTRDTVQAAVDGSGITYLTGGAIPGGEGGQQYPNYLATRGADWSTQGILPPASAGSSGAVVGWSEDLSQVYDLQAKLAGSPASFLARDSSTHALRTIADEGGLDISLTAFVHVDATADGSVVLLESNTPLSPGGASKGFNTYAWDRESGELVLAGALNSELAPVGGTLAGSNESNIHSHYTQAQHTLSNDGKRLFFRDAATSQLYVRQNPFLPQSELSGGACTEPELACTIQVSASQKAVPDPKGIKPATFWGATPDGSKAFFTSPGKLTDDATTGPNDEGNDLYRYDAESGELIDLAPDGADPKGAEVQGVLGASDDGSHIYFAANGKLDTAPSAGSCVGNDELNGGTGACNLYLWHEGTVTFIARTSGADSGNWRSYRPTNAGIENTARVTPDGQTLLFRSQLKLSDYDSEGTRELYLFRVGDPRIQCLSCNPTGAAPVGAATLRSIEKVFRSSPEPASIQTRNLSPDGDRVFFETPDKLVASDTNGDGGCKFVGGSHSCLDVYEWKAEGTGSCKGKTQDDGCLYLLSSGAGPGPSYFADADVKGDNAFLYTIDSLVKQDTDKIVDIYDARVGGGIASQNPPPPDPCASAEACKGAIATPPTRKSPGTSAFQGPGNPPPCKKGRVRRRGRCVKRSHPHKHKRHKARQAARGKRG